MEESSDKTNANLESFLIQFGKTLAKVKLYSFNHPMVSESITNCYGSLSSYLSEITELTITVVDGKFLANGAPNSTLNLAPSPFLPLFEKYSLQSLSFLKEISRDEFMAFLKFLASPKEIADLKSALEKGNIRHIAVNSALYAKVTEGEGGRLIAESGGGSQNLKPQEGALKEWYDKLEELPLESALWEVVQKSITDIQTQKKIYDLIRKQLENEIESYVQKATEGLQKEKRQLTHEQATTKSVIDRLSTGSVMVNEKGEVVMASAGAEKILGKTLGDLKGRNLTQMVSREMMVSLAEEIASFQEAGSTNVQMHGEEFVQQTIQNSTALVQNPEGKVVGIIQTLQDIAKLRELQRMQDDFISHVTHELRSPLTAIKAALGSVEESSKDLENEQVLQIANRNVDRLGRLINDLLDVSKIGAGKMTVNPKPIPAEGVIKDAVQSLESWAKIKGIELVFESKGNLPTLLADPDRTTQILVNLISNAIKFTPANGKIKITTSQPGATYIKIYVSDSGPGMTKEEQQHLFERFYQAKQLTKSDAPGTGLGLYIAKTLTELQKGQIGFESEKGKGTTFYFTLPITRELPKSQTQAAPEKLSIPKKSWLSRLFGNK